MFKKLLSGVSLAVLLPIQGLAITPFVTNHVTAGKQPGDKTRSFFTINEKVIATTPHSRAGETLYPVTLDLKEEAGSSIQCILAYTLDNGEIQLFESYTNNDGEDVLELPEGTYEVLAYGLCDSFKGTLLLYRDNFTFSQGGTLTLDTSAASRQTEIERIGPDGTPLALPDRDGNQGNCSIGSAINLVTLNGQPLFEGSVTQMTNSQLYVRSTPDFPSKLSFYRYQTLLSPSLGMIQFTLPVDLSSRKAGSTATGWQTADINFTRTPFNNRFDEMARQVYEEMGEEYLEFGFGQFLLKAPDDELYVTMGLGMEADGASTACEHISMWVPEGVDLPMIPSVIPTGSVWNGSKSLICGMPVSYGKAGLETSVVNNVAGEFLNTTSNGTFYNSGNPLFGAIPDSPLANCSPSLTTYPTGTGRFNYGFTGRHGEALLIDAFDALGEGLDQEYLDILGGNTSSVLVTTNGETVCDNIADLRARGDWKEDATFIATITTNNILIDNKIEGETKGTLTYNPVKNKKLPSVTALVFTDKEGKLTDRFESGADGSIGLYASVLDFNQAFVGFDYAPVSSVKVEYAPFRYNHAYDTWAEIKVAADPSKDYTPAWGNFYTGPLADVKENAPYGWFAVRLTVETADGASQQQVISPAFCIPPLASVEGIAIESPADVTPEYFTIGGLRVNGPSLAPGLYIERRGTSVAKVLVK